MSLTIISETLTEICKTKHTFRNSEKEFVVQFAFRMGNKDMTSKLIDELAACEEKEAADKVMEQYAKMYEEKPCWINQIENLLVSIELLRIEEEKAINQLAEVLSAYGIDVSEEQVRRADAEEIKEKVDEGRKEQESDVEEQTEKYIPQCTLREPVM